MVHTERLAPQPHSGNDRYDVDMLLPLLAVHIHVPNVPLGWSNAKQQYGDHYGRVLGRQQVCSVKANNSAVVNEINMQGHVQLQHASASCAHQDQ